jgi:hypothetical protein
MRWFLVIALLLSGPFTGQELSHGNIMIIERPVHMCWPFSLLCHSFLVINKEYAISSGPDRDFWNSNNHAYIGRYMHSQDERVLECFSGNVSFKDLQALVDQWNMNQRRYTFSNNCFDFAAWAKYRITHG